MKTITYYEKIIMNSEEIKPNRQLTLVNILHDLFKVLFFNLSYFHLKDQKLFMLFNKNNITLSININIKLSLYQIVIFYKEKECIRFDQQLISSDIFIRNILDHLNSNEELYNDFSLITIRNKIYNLCGDCMDLCFNGYEYCEKYHKRVEIQRGTMND